MDDLISRQAAIDALMPIYKSASLRNRNVFSTARKCMVTIEELQSARPDNQINLCDSCDYSYPDCPSKNGDVIFGNNIGNDNICACNKYKPSARPEQRWIPCSERLPEEYGNYLITTHDGNVDIGTIDPKKKSVWSACDSDGFYWLRNVVAWMPLLKPYEAEGKEE